MKMTQTLDLAEARKAELDGIVRVSHQHRLVHLSQKDCNGKPLKYKFKDSHFLICHEHP